MLDFHTTNALQDPSAYGAYAQPPYAPQLIYSTDLTGPSQDTDHLHYVGNSEYSTHQRLEEHQPSTTDPRIRHPPEITSFTPQEGREGSTIYVYLSTLHDLLALPTLCISLLFASRRVGCTIQLLNHSGAVRHYVVSAEVPAFISMAWHSFSVPLQLVMSGGSGTMVPQAVEVGAFTFSGQVTEASQSRKRKASSSPDGNLQQPVKRTSRQALPTQGQNNGSFSCNQSATSPYSSFVPTPTSTVTYQAGSHQTASPRSFGHHYSTSAASVGSGKAPSPHTPSWSPSFTTVNQSAQSPGPPPPVTPVPRPTITSFPGKSSAPTLIRTSTIQQSPGSIHSAGGTSLASQSFNPYAMYPLKASLKLNGDLDAMAEGWSLEEFDARRRLVQFTRKQSGSTIHADFKGIAPEDRPPNSITISSIWWEEKKECYVTSVDTIFLLESLVAVRFTVEEKNRIRRNLEGFRPLTVSKSKADSEEFFKTIMGFPNPKPRNIEKDVKVFPWKILAHALKKIISKYSASYSSTAGALLTPASSTYASTDASGEHLSVSPPIVATTTPASYPAATTTSYTTHSPRQQIPASVTSGPPNDLRLHLPNVPPLYSIPSNYAFQPAPQASESHSMSAPVSRTPGSWDFTNFVNTSPATSAPGTLANFSYSQSATGVDSRNFMPPSSYSGI